MLYHISCGRETRTTSMSFEMPAPDLLRFLAVLNAQLRLDRLMPAVLDFSLNLARAERAFLMLSDDQGELSIKAARNANKQDLNEQDFQGSTSIIRKVLEEKQPLYVPFFEPGGEFASSESIRRWNLQSAVCLPLWQDQEQTSLAGVLYLDSSSSVDPLRKDHLQLMQAMANFVAVSLTNAKLFEEVQNQKREIASLNDQLRKRVEIQAVNLAGMKILLAETQRELGKVYGLGNIVGKSKPMLKVFKILDKIVGTSATVLILGESGTGKEIVARYIHYNGPRAEMPMVSINCSAFNDTLLESELFGHRKGAFTGATENKMGLFHLADGGTLFLDEIGDMSLEMQKKLLRVLQDGEVRSVGGKEVVRVDVRIIAATNRDLQKLIEQEKFREDLFFRLNVINLSLPSLRERREDIPLLIDFFTNKISSELQRPLKPPAGEVLKKFLEYDWPGNVRQLENELRRVFILESEYELELLQNVADDEDASQDASMVAVEKRAILKALESAHGNKSKAAEILGIPRRTFYKKLVRYNIY